MYCFVGYLPVVLIKFNLVDLNRQAKMYSQGMAPVYKMIPGRPNWERIRDKPTYIVSIHEMPVENFYSSALRIILFIHF